MGGGQVAAPSAPALFRLRACTSYMGGVPQWMRGMYRYPHPNIYNGGTVMAISSPNYIPNQT